MKLNLNKVLIVAIVFLSSCEKVIEPKIKNTDSQLVIEGEISNNGQSAVVKISKSMSFVESGRFNGISNAIVSMSDDVGNSETLSMQSSGIYLTSSLLGVPGRTYFLDVTVDGIEYSSSCKMPKAVEMDTLIQMTQIANDNTRRFLIPVYNDQVSEINFYRIKVYSLDEPVSKIFVRNDLLIDGKKVTQPVGPFFFELSVGDTATVVLQSIDKSVYRFFNGLEQALNPSSASPANPPSNIAGGCLGYFSAHTRSEKKILIKD